MDQKVERVNTPISEPQMAQAIIEAWRSMFGAMPSKEQVSMILAQNNLETGHRKSMWNYNVGNITHTKGDGFDYWEGLDWLYDYFTDTSGFTQKQKKTVKLKYRSYPDLNSGVKDYLKLLNSKHYAGAFEHIIHPDPVAYSKALKAGGYYTADEASYTAGIKSLFDQANKSNSYEQAVSGKAQSATGVSDGSMVANNKGLYEKFMDWFKKNEQDVYNRLSGDGQTHSSIAPVHVPPTISNISTSTTQASPSVIDKLIDSYLSMEVAATDHSSRRLYRKYLPNNHLTILISASSFTDAVEFSRILCSVLDIELSASAFIHTNGRMVEVECSIPGPAKECFDMAQELTESTAKAFETATRKIGGVIVTTKFLMNKKSSYQQLPLSTAEIQYRKFLLKFM